MNPVTALFKTICILFVLLVATNSFAQTPSPIKLQKIIFHSSSCYGSCPIESLQIDSNRNVELSMVRSGQARKAVSREGSFKGTLDKKTYEKLLSILNTANPDTLNFGYGTCCDAPMKTVIIYYNGQRKYFTAMFTSKAAYPLLDFLYGICKSAPLKKTTTKFKFEE